MDAFPLHGDLAAWAGAPFEMGDNEGRLQPPTLMFTLRNVDVKRARQALIDQSDRFKLQDIPAEQVARSGTVSVRAVPTGAGLKEIGILRPPSPQEEAPKQVEHHHGHGGHH